MKNYQYILLDWDGNLAKTLDIWMEALRSTLAEVGHFPDDREIAGATGKFTDYFARRGLDNPRALSQRANEIGKQKLTNVELYPYTLEALGYFKKLGKKTALITTSYRENIDHLLDRYDMHGLFDVVVTAESVTEHKPHPEPLLKALEELGGNIDEAIMIGDSDKDLGAAVNAGVDSMLFYPPEHAKYYDLEYLKTHQPTYIVEDFRAVMEIVK